MKYNHYVAVVALITLASLKYGSMGFVISFFIAVNTFFATILTVEEILNDNR